jgi:flagellar M-ring protein FliF
VAAEIDPTMEVEKQILKYDTDPTPVSNKTTRIEVTNSRQPVGGVPGVAINAIGNRAASLSEPEPSGVETSRTKEDQRESIGVAGQHYENSKLAALQVKSVRVSVGLPTSYYENLHSQEFLKQNVDKAATDVPPLTDDDLENLRTRTKKTIQSAVTVLLPKEVAGSDRLPQVEVWDYTELPEPQLIEPETPHVALTWLAESWQTLALIGLGILALLVAHSVARSVTRGSSPAPDAFASARALENPHETLMSEHQDEERWRTNGSGKSLRDELLMLVEDNPEAAASVIRGWVAEAA